MSNLDDSISIDDSLEVGLEMIKAIREAYDKDIIVTVPTGNYGPLPNTLSPIAQLPWVISVGATNEDGSKLADYSSIGLPNDPLNRPTLVAKGFSVPLNGEVMTGTSFASARVSGLLGRLKQMRQVLKLPWSVDIARQILNDIAIPIKGYDTHEVGYGFISEEVVSDYFKSIDLKQRPLYLWGNYYNLLPLWTKCLG